MLERRHLFGWTAGMLLLDSSANLISFGMRLLDVAAAYATVFFFWSASSRYGDQVLSSHNPNGHVTIVHGITEEYADAMNTPGMTRSKNDLFKEFQISLCMYVFVCPPFIIDDIFCTSVSLLQISC